MVSKILINTKYVVQVFLEKQKDGRWRVTATYHDSDRFEITFDNLEKADELYHRLRIYDWVELDYTDEQD